MNNLIFRSGHLQNVITTDNFSLDRIEVLSGPASSVYGTDALGGVVHLITLNPKFAESDKLLVESNIASRYSTANNEKTLHGDLNLGWKNFSSFTSFTLSEFGDLRGGKAINPFYGKSFGERNFYVSRINNSDSLLVNSTPELQVGSAYKQYDAVQKLAFKSGKSGMHKLNFQYSTSSDVSRYDRLTDPTATGLKFAEWYYGPQKRFLAAYDYSQNLKQGFFGRIKAGLNFQDIEESRIDRKFGNPKRTSRIENVQVAGAFTELVRDTEKHTLRLGADGVLLSNDTAAMQAMANQFDFLLNTIPVYHDYNVYLPLLKVDGTQCIVGTIGMNAELNARSLIMGRRSIAGSLVGGIQETQEMLDFCAQHQIVSDIEMIPMNDINQAYERMQQSDVKYRFVIDMSTLA